MLLDSFSETQRTSRSALATIQHFSSLTQPLPVADAAPTANDDGGPDRGVALVGMRRLQTRVGGRQQYAAVRGHHDPTLFKTLCGLTREEVDAIVELSRERVEMPMDPRLCYSVENNQARRPRRRVCSTVEIICLTLVLLRGGDEGALSLRLVAFDFGVSVATVSNTFYHCVFSLHDAFMAACPIA